MSVPACVPSTLPKGYPRGSELLEMSGLVTEFKPATSIYTMRAHGCDWNCAYTVPTNCMYVKNISCGTSFDDIGDVKFVKEFATPSELLQNPLAHERELSSLLLSEAFGWSGAKKQLSINHPSAFTPAMRMYQNTIFTPFVKEWQHCGLQRLGATLYTVDPEDPESFNYRAPGVIDLFTSGLTKDALIQHYLKKFELSLFPTKEQVSALIRKESEGGTFPRMFSTWTSMTAGDAAEACDNEFEVLMDEFRVDLKTLFAYFPGIYYSISCRAPCGEDGAEPIWVGMRRQQSAPPIVYPNLTLMEETPRRATRRNMRKRRRSKNNRRHRRSSS